MRRKRTPRRILDKEWELAREIRQWEYHRVRDRNAIRNALYEFDKQEMRDLRAWLADNAWVLLGITEEEWHSG